MNKGKDIVIRDTRLSDADLYFEWVNDDAVRKSSFSPGPIAYDDHINWFKKYLSAKNVFMYLFEQGSNAVGQVRFETGDKVIINISIDKRFRGAGLGSMIISDAVKKYYSDSGEDKPVTAYIKENNLASFRVFTAAGFTDAGEDLIHGIVCRRLLKNKSD